MPSRNVRAMSDDSDSGHERKRQKLHNDRPVDKIDEHHNSLALLLKTGSFSDIDVIVGREGHVFKLHKAILCHNSGYFRTILKSKNFIEGRESRVVLANHSREEFDYVSTWLYTAQLPSNFIGSKWNVLKPVTAIKNAVYFDIPSLARAASRDVCRNFYHYGPHSTRSAEDKKQLVEALKIIFELYGSNSELLDPIVQVLHTQRLIPFVLKNGELRVLLGNEPTLMARVLDIQNGIEFHDNF